MLSEAQLSVLGWMSALFAGLALALALPGAPTVIQAPGLPLRPAVGSVPAAGSGRTWRRALLCGLAGLGVWLLIGGGAGAVAGCFAAVGAYRVLARQESTEARREREAAVRELPHLVGLLSGPLRAGLSVEPALQIVCRALPGPAAARFEPALGQLSVGIEPARVWSELAADPALAPLGRALARTHVTGASVVDSIEALSSELVRGAFADVEDRARRVGVKAAVPLGVCLLPAFLLLGIVPLVAGLMSTVLR